MRRYVTEQKVKVPDLMTKPMSDITSNFYKISFNDSCSY